MVNKYVSHFESDQADIGKNAIGTKTVGGRGGGREGRQMFGRRRGVLSLLSLKYISSLVHVHDELPYSLSQDELDFLLSRSSQSPKT